MAAKNPSTTNGVKLTPGDIAFQKKLIRKVRTAPALIDVGDIERFETRAQQRDAVRRYMWAIMSMPGKDLIERVRADRKYAVMMADVADELHRYHDSTSELLSFV